MTRPPTLGISVGFIMLGLVASGSAPSAPVIQAAAVGTLFHIGAFVLNDIFDLGIDKTDPRRARDPLVSGDVTVTQAVLVVIGAFTLGVVLVIVRRPLAGSLGLYLLATCCLIIYDAFGKKSSLPPLMDFLQGVGWGSLVLLGGYLSAGRVEAPALSLAGWACLYVATVNGTVGALRDLRNDRTRMARTTASYFVGNRSAGNKVGQRYRAYALVLVLAQIAIASWTMVHLASFSRSIPCLALGVGGQLVAGYSLVAGMRHFDQFLCRGGQRRYRLAGFHGMVYIILSPWSMLVAFSLERGWVGPTLSSLMLIAPWSLSRVALAELGKDKAGFRRRRVAANSAIRR